MDAMKGGAEQIEVIDALKPTEVDKIPYHPAIHEDIYLQMVVKDSMVDFFYSKDGKKYHKAGEQFRMKEGRWIGAKVGLLAVQPAGNEDRGWVDADWFRVTR